MTRILTRRKLLVGSAAALAAPYVSSRPARAAGQVVVRNPGGAYSDTQKQYIYDPFSKETGIEVVIVASTLTKMLAMVKSGNAELDVADAGFDGLVTLDHTGALAPIDYAGWKYTDAKDVPEEYMTPTMVGLALYATVLGYNKEAFPEGKQPKSWAEFWDVAKFPGARMLEDMAVGTPNLEFALIADGVPMDKVFPIDIDRAFKSLSRIKPHIKKFWDTGALSAQMLADNLRQARQAFPEASVDELLKIAASGYNCGSRAAIAGARAGDSDQHTTGHNYGADVIARMKLFEELAAEKQPSVLSSQQLAISH